MGRVLNDFEEIVYIKISQREKPTKTCYSPPKVEIGRRLATQVTAGTVVNYFNFSAAPAAPRLSRI